MQFAAGAVPQNRYEQDQRDGKDRHRDKQSIPARTWLQPTWLRHERGNAETGRPQTKLAHRHVLQAPSHLTTGGQDRPKRDDCRAVDVIVHDRLRQRLQIALYTPGESNGRPLTIPLMPEGVEKTVSVADMADLLSFLKGWRYREGMPFRAK